MLRSSTSTPPASASALSLNSSNSGGPNGQQPLPPPGSASSLSTTYKTLRRQSSRQKLVSRRPSGILTRVDSTATKNSIEKETKIVDGVAFTAIANLNKFTFKKTTVTAAQDEISDDSSQGPDGGEGGDGDTGEIHEGKARNFEFTNNKSVMRVFRVIIFLQMIGFICDNPAVQFPPLFDVLCRTPLFYLIRFYSYPFVDLVYLIQRIWKRAIHFLMSLATLQPPSTPNTPQQPGAGDSPNPTSRRLDWIR
jgi:hypothetical protein